jgi:4-amino-4-deoxy-L-arabinose transferase-like glycosyltransferase
MNQNSSPYNSPRTLWAIAIIFVLIWLYMLGARTLVPTDEGRYAQMAREMFMSGDWITQRLNGIKYFEKPPLQNWMNALSFELFGLGDWQARLWTGLCGLLGIAISTYTALKVFNRRIAIHTAFILGASFFWAGLAHVNTLDMGLAGMMTLTLCGLLLAQRDNANALEQRNAMLLCWAGMALATLSKGLIGFVLPGAVLVIYTLVSRDFALWTRLHMGKGLMLFFAITAPWFILVWQANPEHPHFFFIHEHFQRFTSNVHHREGAWHYFIPVLVLGIFPWIGFLLQGLWSGVKENSYSSQTKTLLKPHLMLVIWAAFIFFFFSISGSKLPSYILPIFPALSILIAYYIEKSTDVGIKINAASLIVIGIIGMALSPKIGSLAKDVFVKPYFEVMIPWVFGASALLLACGLAAFWFSKKNKDLAIIFMAVGGFLSGQAIFLGHDQWGQYSAGTIHLTAIQKELKDEGEHKIPFYGVNQYEQSLPYYLQRKLILVSNPDEMAFGLEQQPELWIPHLSDFVIEWKKHQTNNEKAIAIMHPSMYEKLLSEGVTSRLIAKDPKRVIVITQ